MIPSCQPRPAGEQLLHHGLLEIAGLVAPGPVAETRDLDENAVLDLDDTGRICAITVEHATERTGIPTFSYEHVVA